jgi:uncharacterized protein YkwD
MRRYAPHVYLLACALLLLPAAGRAQQLAVTPRSPYTMLEQEIASEINLARTRPAEYAAFVEQFRAYYSGREFRQPGKSPFLTEEGVAALDEAVNFLRASRPLPSLAVSAGMCSGAKELVADQTASGATGHKGADGSFCEQRLGRFGAWTDPVGENLSYGLDTARERVVSLLIDDGFSTRGHRNRLLSPAFKVVGVACGGHKMGAVCVITLAAGFTQKAAPANPRPAAKSTAAPQLPGSARRF